MLHVIQSADVPAADEALRGMFAARKSVFVDLLRWEVPVLAGAYEVDQFDDPHATYILLTDERGGHLGSARLLQTTRPHILDSLYPQLCAGDPPRGSATREITRFCLDRRLRAAERRVVRDALVCTLVDHALAGGISDYTAVAEMGWFQQILAFGWRCRPLGLPTTVGRSTLAAFRIEIDTETPGRLRTAGLRPETELVVVQRRAA